ncbi:MAG: hypothetical protein WC205_04130 [Opitutaceae bacterium]|jgi:hypothetical protein
MDPKFSAEYWDDPRIIELDLAGKIAGAWLFTNARVNYAGYAEVSLKVFSFQTEAPPEALDRAMTALGESCVRVGNGYWLRSYIRRQIGEGAGLVRNCMCSPLLRDLRAMPADAVELVLNEYPDLRPVFELEALPTPSPSPVQGLPKHKRREEKSRAEQSGAESGVGGAGGRGAKPRGFTTPAEHPEPLASRLVAVGALKRRGESDAWTPEEIDAFELSGLGRLSDTDFAAQLEPMRRYYGANIPRGKGLPPDRRRLEIRTLIEHWAGELDKARAYTRENDDGYTRAN